MIAVGVAIARGGVSARSDDEEMEAQERRIPRLDLPSSRGKIGSPKRTGR